MFTFWIHGYNSFKAENGKMNELNQGGIRLNYRK